MFGVYYGVLSCLLTVLNRNKPCAVLAAEKACGILGCIRRSDASRLKEVTLNLCLALIWPCKFWAPQYKGDMEQLERIQWRAAMMSVSPIRKGWESWVCLEWNTQLEGPTNIKSYSPTSSGLTKCWSILLRALSKCLLNTYRSGTGTSAWRRVGAGGSYQCM